MTIYFIEHLLQHQKRLYSFSIFSQLKEMWLFKFQKKITY
jgi:hypothetical protein